jgi:hypothetical protein
MKSHAEAASASSSNEANPSAIGAPKIDPRIAMAKIPSDTMPS